MNQDLISDRQSVREVGGGFGRELGVISVTVETGAGFVEDVAEGKKVKNRGDSTGPRPGGHLS